MVLEANLCKGRYPLRVSTSFALLQWVQQPVRGTICPNTIYCTSQKTSPVSRWP